MRQLCALLLIGWIVAGAGRAQTNAAPQETVIQAFNGTDTLTTPDFSVHDGWLLRGKSDGPVSVAVLATDGSVAATLNSSGYVELTIGKGGTYHLQITPPARGKAIRGDWSYAVVQPVLPTTPQASSAATNAAPVAAATNSAPSSIMPFETNQPPQPPSAAMPTLASTSATPPNTGNLTEQQAHAVVVIKGDVAEGTGFLVHGPDGPAVITNLHVLAANPNVKIFTTTGQQITTTGLKGASDRDLAMIAIQDNHYSYLDLATDIAGTVQNGDEVITPGNSEGGEVVLDTKGAVLGVGPERIEFSNPIYHGNSGGPVFHTKSGKVIAVVTQAMKVRADNEIDKASFANKNSAISGTMRYFGLRIDTVPQWETYDWAQFLNQTTFINNFHDVSRCLDSFMNGARYEQSHVASTDEYGPPNAMYYLKNAKLVAAHDNFHHMTADADQSQRLDAGREIIMDLEGVASTDMAPMQNAGNFYAYEAIRAQQEVKYRQALAKEVESAGDKISDMGH